jgi:superoxide dismutase, Cu-Zn family
VKTSSFAAILAFGTLGLLVACGGAATEPPAAPPAPPPAPAVEVAPAEAPAPAAAAPAEPPKLEPRMLQVKLEAKSGSKLSGSAMLMEVDGGVKVTLSVEGVPAGDHGAHVHEKGDCSAPDGASAGGHFNPTSNEHALPTTPKRHLGDLGNLTVGKDGKGSLEITISGANLKAGDPNSFAGKAIIIHAKKDDGGQPVGNAGGRIGCGVIGA